MLVNVLCLSLLVVVKVATVPDAGTDILVRHFVEYAIATKSNEVMLFADLEDADVGSGDYYIRVAASVIQFRFRVTKCSGY